MQRPNGKKITSFKVLKGKDGVISQVRGITSKENDSMYNIHMNVVKKIDHGLIQKKHKSFKIKSSDLLTLLKESKSKNLKESSNIQKNKQIKEAENKVVREAEKKVVKQGEKKVLKQGEKKVLKQGEKKVVKQGEKKVVKQGEKKAVKKEKKM